MMSNDSELAGRALRDHIVVDTDPASHAVERARLVTAATSRPASRRPVLAFAAALTIAAVIVFFAWKPPTKATNSLSFTVGPDTRAGEVGLYYGATPDTELPLRFSDGSTVSVKPRGGVRVHQSQGERVALFVETGQARFDVVHRPRARWEIAAGPYSVSVTGTSFDLSWTPEDRTFELEMHSGSVTVRGPGIESGVIVQDTDRFVSRVTADVNRPPASTAPSEDPEPALPEDSLDDAPEPKPEPGDKPSSSRSTSEKSEPSWTALASRGDYASIVRAAEERGIDESIAGASADELRALADAARFTGHSALAKRALLAIRSRFPGSKAATAAAFVIGRMLDSAGDAQSAVGWYDRYLAEGGALAAEALGRRMLALHRSGDRGAGRNAAAEYLRRFPDGPYARQARKLSR